MIHLSNIATAPTHPGSAWAAPLFSSPVSQTSRWETEDAYLSGNVREKFSAAEASALIDSQFLLTYRIYVSYRQARVANIF